MANEIVFSKSAVSKPVISGKISWKGGPSIQQNFSLPSSIIYYISKNPSTSTQYLKLVQSCKYFFEKLPILVAKDFYGERQLCPFEENKCSKNRFKCCVTINPHELSSKIWITNKINICVKQDANYFSLFSSKIYRSEIHRFCIYYQKIFFNDFKVMASSATFITLINASMVYDDDTIVPLDAILEVLPKIEKFEYSFHVNTFGPSTLKNIAKLKNLSNIQLFHLINFPEISNVQDFLAVIKKLKNAKIHLEFDDNIISREFKNQLADLINAVVEEEASKCLIEYIGQDTKKWKLMEKEFYKK